MRLPTLAAMALGVGVAACAGPPPVAIVQQHSYASCTPSGGEGEALGACKKPPRLAGSSSGLRSARSNVPVFDAGGPSGMSEVPVMDVEQVCQGIAEQGGATFQDTEKVGAKKHCLDDEQKVHNTLVKVWRSFDVADRTHCANESRMGGQSSYSELITCLEMAQAVRKMHEEVDPSRSAQTIGQR